MSEPVGRSVQAHMSKPELILHTLLVMGTLGVWLPFYLARKRKIQATMIYYRN